MTQQKRPYEAPRVLKVRLVVRNNVLGVCHASPVLTPKLGSPTGCALPGYCYDGPGTG